MNKKYRITSLVMLIAVIAVFITLNVFVTALTDRIPIKLDMTKNKVFTLSDSTKDYLKGYDTPTEIYVLASKAEEDRNIRLVLDRFAGQSPKIQITNIDTKTNPTFGQKYILNGETLSEKYIIIDGGDRFKAFSIAELYSINQRTGKVNALKLEDRLISALKYISSPGDMKAYILTGHNEIDSSAIVSVLEDENYIVKELNLLTEDIPNDASLLVDMSPGADLAVSEIVKLDEYLAGGGHTQFYFDVQHSERLSNLYEYLAKWGIQVHDTVAVERSNSNTLSLGGTPLLTAKIQSDAITDSIIENSRTIAYLPYSKSLEKLFDSRSYVSVKPLLTTTESAYETADYEYLTGTKGSGKLNIGILASNSKNNSSIYVSGTSMLMNFSQDDVSSSYGFANYDYFINICSFMQGNTNDYTVSAKSLSADTISITPAAACVIGIIFVILIPLILLIAGIVVWIKRRHL